MGSAGPALDMYMSLDVYMSNANTCARVRWCREWPACIIVREDFIFQSNFDHLLGLACTHIAPEQSFLKPLTEAP